MQYLGVLRSVFGVGMRLAYSSLLLWCDALKFFEFPSPTAHAAFVVIQSTFLVLSVVSDNLKQLTDNLQPDDNFNNHVEISEFSLLLTRLSKWTLVKK